MDKINLVLWKDATKLNEIFQSVDIKFAHVNDKYEQVHQPCKCRDFLGDLMWSMYHKKSYTIYGMKYDYSENPYDMEVTRLSLKFPTTDQYNNFITNFSYLTDREREYGIPESVLLGTDQENTLIIEGDKAWQKSVWRLSLYTFYMKVMAYPDVTNLSNPEADYRVALTDEHEMRLLELVMTDKAIYIVNSLDTNHNSSGFIAMITFYKQKQYYKDHYPNSEYIRNAKEIFGDTW